MTATAAPLTVAVNAVPGAAASANGAAPRTTSTAPRRNFVSALADVRDANAPSTDPGELANGPAPAKSATDTIDDATLAAKAGNGSTPAGGDPAAGAQAQAAQQATLAQLLASAPAPVLAPATPGRGTDSTSAGAPQAVGQTTVPAGGQGASPATLPWTTNPAVLALPAAAPDAPEGVGSSAVAVGTKGSLPSDKGAVKAQAVAGAILEKDDEPETQAENSSPANAPASHFVDKGASLQAATTNTPFGDPSSGTGSDASGSGQPQQDDVHKLALLITGTAGASVSAQASQVSADSQFASTATSAAVGGAVTTPTAIAPAGPSNDTSGAGGVNAHVIHENVGSSRWADELGAKLTVMATRGEQTGSLRLSPAHLGPLQVDITVRNDQASVQFGAQHADTRAALQDALPRLREMFAASGLVLGDAGVSREAPRQNAPAQVAIRGFSNASGEEATVQTLTLSTNALNAHRGVLDTYA